MKKGQALNTGLFISVAVIVLVFVVIGLIMGFGAKISGDVASDLVDSETPVVGCNDTLSLKDMTNCPASVNITRESLTAQETMAEYQNTWATIVAAAVIIIILIGAVLGTVLMLQK